MGFYLGGVFFSISKGMPTGIAALIVTLQPILTNALSGPILNEKVTSKQWLGVLLGFIGAALVLGLDIGSEIPVAGLIATIVALIAITSSTIWQKKLSNNLPFVCKQHVSSYRWFFFSSISYNFFSQNHI
jgi:drug/metabolite transporter (DMT)-like permease